MFSDTTADHTSLDLEWDGVRVSIPIDVPTDDLVAASIAVALPSAFCEACPSSQSLASAAN